MAISTRLRCAYYLDEPTRTGIDVGPSLKLTASSISSPMERQKVWWSISSEICQSWLVWCWFRYYVCGRRRFVGEFRHKADAHKKIMFNDSEKPVTVAIIMTTKRNSTVIQSGTFCCPATWKIAICSDTPCWSSLFCDYGHRFEFLDDGILIACRLNLTNLFLQTQNSSSILSSGKLACYLSL